MTLKMIILRSSFSFQALTFRLTFVTFASISRNFSPPTYKGRKVGCSSTTGLVNQAGTALARLRLVRVGPGPSEGNNLPGIFVEKASDQEEP